MRKRKSEQNFETKMEMTPLIDCVFLLIMFFILTTQITVKIEEVTLPFSIEGKPQEVTEADAVALIINVPKDLEDTAANSRKGKIVFNGNTLKPQELLAELKKEVFIDAQPRPAGRGRQMEIGPNGVKLSQLEVLIRYDEGVQAKHLRDIFEMCQQAGIYKLKFATQPPQTAVQ